MIEEHTEHRPLSSESDRIGAALSRIPSGCSILTCAHDDRATGVLVSWVQQAGFSPPMITLCLKPGRFAEELINASKRFLLNVIGEDPKPMFKHFGRGFGPEEPAFIGIDTISTPFGMRLSGCIAHLACEVEHALLLGDHKLFAARVVSAEALPSAKPYLHLRNNGLSY
jgi:flavin reductase (DIM6/NTAB) family NADH-FMN oxidoreductase RutF